MPAKKPFHYVYILVSEKERSRHFVGITQDLDERIRHQNSGASAHTAKHLPFARALVNTAVACAEAIGVPEDVMPKEMTSLEPHCGSAGKSIESQVKAPVGIAKGWMVPGITKAIAQANKDK